MPKSDHLHLVFFCRSRIVLAMLAPSASRLLRIIACTGVLASLRPAFNASSSRDDWSGRRLKARAPFECFAATGGFWSITANAVRRIGVVERRLFSSTTTAVEGQFCWETSTAALEP